MTEQDNNTTREDATSDQTVPDETVPDEQPRRPSPTPSLTPTQSRPAPSPAARARRAAAVAPANRPSPRPRPADAEPPAAAAIDLNKAADSKDPKAQRAGRFGGPRAKRTGETRQSAGPRRAPVWSVVVLIVVALMLASALTWVLTANHRSNSHAAQDKVLAAAKSGAGLLLSYNYQHIDADKATTLPHLTGKFATDYATSMDTVIKPQAPKVKAVVEGQVDSAGIESVSPNGKQVVVVVFGQQKVSNTGLTQPRTDIARLRVTLDLVGDTWKISNLSQI
jgi:Mce-associated membrane protein